MADNCVFNRESGEIGDKIRINGHDCIVQNSYKLVTNPTTNETYYEIKLLTNDNIVVIDEASITKILLIIIGDTIYNKKWTFCNNTIMSRITNDKALYLGRYLLNYLEGDNKVYNDNGNKMDFRLNNLVLKTQGEINSLAKRVRKPAVLKPASEFFKDEPKELLIQHPYNSYVILKLISTNEEYVKMHIKDSYHTIFNRESLDDVMKFNWYICNTYVGTKIPTSCTDPKILAFYKKGDCIYLHRYLIQLQGIEIPEDQSIDHINHNKLDNRLANLRVATQSEQNRNRPTVTRTVEIPKEINQDDKLNKDDIPQFISLAKPKDGHSSFFNIEINYPGMGRLRTKSSSKNTLNLTHKLCDAIHKRYLLILKNNLNIQLLIIDGQKFATNDEFLVHTNNLIKNLMLTINIPEITDIETLLPYLAKLEYQKSTIKKKPPTSDIGAKLVDALVEEPVPVPAQAPVPVPVPVPVPEEEPKQEVKLEVKAKIKKAVNKVAVDQPANGIVYKTPLTLDNIHLVYDRVKPQFISYHTDGGRAPKFEGDYLYRSVPRKKLNFGGLSDITLTLNEKLAWTVLKRYSVFVHHENEVNDLIYEAGAVPPNHGKNTNTTGLRTLSDVTFNECNLFEMARPPTQHTFNSFATFRAHTETYISNILNVATSLEDYVTYVRRKVPRLKTPVLTLKYPDATILTK
jgi:hypothetical protein